MFEILIITIPITLCLAGGVVYSVHRFGVIKTIALGFMVCGFVIAIVPIPMLFKEIAKPFIYQSKGFEMTSSPLAKYMLIFFIGLIILIIGRCIFRKASGSK